MGFLFSPPKMPSASELAKQQLEVQRQLQADADSRSAKEMADIRKQASVDQRRRAKSRRGRTSLITKRALGPGLLGITDDTARADTLSPLGTDYTAI